MTAAERRRQSGAVLTVEQAARLLGIGKSTAYRQVKEGSFGLPTYRSGRRWIVPRHIAEERYGADEVAAAVEREEGVNP